MGHPPKGPAEGPSLSTVHRSHTALDDVGALPPDGSRATSLGLVKAYQQIVAGLKAVDTNEDAESRGRSGVTEVRLKYRAEVGGKTRRPCQ